MTVESPPTAPSARPWRLVLALAGVLAVIAFWRTLRPQDPAVAPLGTGTAITVTVEQQRPEIEPLLCEVSLPPNPTVYDAVQAAGRDGDPQWASVWRGAGEMALLESLGGIASDGAAGGPAGLNWQFEVNGVYATRGAGAIRLESGDRVLWKLAPYE